MVCEYTFDEESRTIICNCLGCIYGSSIEDYEICMARTIEKLMENPSARSVVLRRNRNYEYDYDQVKILQEIAKVIKTFIRDWKVLSRIITDLPGCERYIKGMYAEIYDIIMNKMKSDPIGAYVLLRRRLRRLKSHTPSTQKERECYDGYANGIIAPMVELLEKTQLIQLAKPYLSGYRPGSRDIYREIFHPVIRPNFMLTKYMSQPPQNGEIIEKYEVPGGVEVEIYKIPGNVRFRYHAIPPEFKLSEDKYTIMDAARRYLEEHKPREADFSEPERAREVFMNIGIDLINDIASRMGIELTREEIEELANILVRYTPGLGILEILLADQKITDIFINSPVGTKPIYIFHSDFQECDTNFIPTREEAEVWATRFRLMSGRPLDEANPVLDTEINVPGGRARVAVVTRTLSPEGIGFALRRHRDKPWTYPLYLQPKIRYINPLFAGLMSFLVDGSRTILIAGTRSSGKTSLLGATMLELMRKTRIVTVEDTLELPVPQLRELGYNIERLKTRSVITQVETELPAEEAIRTALRLGDSSLIIGEVRSTEARALYEAMRIGALANTVAGTLHGDSPYGVFDRVVNDLGVKPTSFKATDIIVICNNLKSADGLHTFKRVIGVTEVRKHWKNDPEEEGGFVNLLEYSSKDDNLKPTQTLLNGESEILNGIASRIREWAGNWSAVWENIMLRGRIKQTITDIALKTGKLELMEAPFVVKSNDMFHIICDELREEVGSIPSEEVFKRWYEWVKNSIKENRFYEIG